MKTKNMEEEDIIYMKTDIKIIKDMVAILSQFEDDCVISFEEDSLRTIVIDPSHVSVIDMKIKKTSLMEYASDGKYDIGIDLEKLEDSIKYWKNIACFTFYKKDGTIEMSAKNRNELGEYARKMETMDTASFQKVKIPTIESDVEFTLSPKGLLQFLKEASNIADFFTINTDKQIVNFHAKKDTDKVEFVPESIDNFNIDKKCNVSFSIETILNIVKKIKNYKSITIKIKNDKPMIIKGSGKIDFMMMVAPRIDEFI
jgi:proliferating cell nuclear antigen